MRVLVTGGFGYIGGHACLALRDAGHQVTILDDGSGGPRPAALADLPAVTADLSGPAGAAAAAEALARGTDAVMHFAGRIAVGESVENPELYWRVNLAGGLNLLAAMQGAGVQRLVFSSTAAVYHPSDRPLPEDAPKAPASPYGRSKLAFEQVIHDVSRARGLGAVIFRYFNACGADPRGRLGEEHQPETHLVPRVLALARASEPVTIFGTDYPTRDGTCVRDYVHVSDIVDAHVRALAPLEASPGKVFTYNLGLGAGHSVREVIAAAGRVLGRPLAVKELPRRPGDAPTLVADPAAAVRDLGWEARHRDLEGIIASAWNWLRARPR